MTQVIRANMGWHRSQAMAVHGAACTINSEQTDARAIRKLVRIFCDDHGVPPWRLRIFEAGGTFTRFGYTEVLYVMELLGLLMMWRGYVISVRP